MTNEKIAKVAYFKYKQAISFKDIFEAKEIKNAFISQKKEFSEIKNDLKNLHTEMKDRIAENIE